MSLKSSNNEIIHMNAQEVENLINLTVLEINKLATFC